MQDQLLTMNTKHNKSVALSKRLSMIYYNYGLLDINCLMLQTYVYLV